MPENAGPGGPTDRRTFLKLLAAGAAGGVLPGLAGCRGPGRRGFARSSKRQPPNIVVILVDDMGWTDVACFGSGYYETPNIDRLASQGMKFTNAYAACAVCSPTRAAVMTGRYPARVGITNWIWARFQGGFQPTPEDEPLSEHADIGDGKGQRLLCPRNPFWMEHSEITIAEALKSAGYRSGYVGKWHLGTDHWYPPHQGFDFNVGGCDFGHPPSYFDPYWNKHQSYIPTLPPREKGEYLTDREADEAVQFIRENQDRSFFLQMAHYAVHTPIQAKEDLVAKYEGRETTNHKNPKYAAMVESVDDATGRIMDTLDELGLTDETIVIFTSDNGGLIDYPQHHGPTNNAPLRSGKGFPYEGGIRVPAIVRWPGVVDPGSVCHEPITSPDYFPTILAAAGVPLPDDRAIDGENLAPLLKQSGTLRRDAIYWHFPHYRGRRKDHALPRVVPYSIIRAGDWKLIKFYDGDHEFELYNLADDIGETNDLAAKLATRVKELDARLTAHLTECGAKLPIPNPDYQPAAESP